MVVVQTVVNVSVVKIMAMGVMPFSAVVPYSVTPTVMHVVMHAVVSA